VHISGSKHLRMLCLSGLSGSQFVDPRWSRERGRASCGCCQLACCPGELPCPPTWAVGWDPAGARLSVVVRRCSPSCAVLAGVPFLTEAPRALGREENRSQRAGMGLFGRNTTASPGWDFNGHSPYFKRVTLSTVTVITRRLRNSQTGI